MLGYSKKEPWEKRSNTKQDATNIYIDEKAKQTVIFAYPHLFTNPSTLQVIRLEIGALAGMLAKHIVSLYDI